VKNHRSTATYLAGFRNYAYYHIQAWKCYLHARVLRRLNIVQKVPLADSGPGKRQDRALRPHLIRTPLSRSTCYFLHSVVGS
jgi:hypothetical protein